MTDKLYNINDKKNKQLMAKKIVCEKKDDLEFLKALYKYSGLAINQYDNYIKEQKLKELIPTFNFKIIKYIEENDVQDSRSNITLEISVCDIETQKTYNLKIHKQTSHSKNSDDILEEFYIKLDNNTIYSSCGKSAYKENIKIEDKTLKINISDDTLKENIFIILHFFNMY